MIEKRGSLSQSCQSVVGALQNAFQGLAALRGRSADSLDGKELGQVVEVKKDADGKIQSIQIELGRWLGLGSKVVTIPADKFEQLADRIKLHLRGEEVEALPDTAQQSKTK